jgi:RNA exonuclease NGL2
VNSSLGIPTKERGELNPHFLRSSPDLVRQAALLVREVIAFQELRKLRDWPCIIAGGKNFSRTHAPADLFKSKRRADFNFPPDDPAYSLLVGEPLSLEQQERLQVSRVVHVSIDSTVPTFIAKEAAEGGGEQEADPDKVIRNSRDSKPSDGLLSDAELSSLVGHRLRSAYDEGQRSSLLEGNDVATYGARKRLPAEKAGACEPTWTSFTHYWKTTLGNCPAKTNRDLLWLTKYQIISSF